MCLKYFYSLICMVMCIPLQASLDSKVPYEAFNNKVDQSLAEGKPKKLKDTVIDVTSSSGNKPVNLAQTSAHKERVQLRTAKRSSLSSPRCPYWWQDLKFPLIMVTITFVMVGLCIGCKVTNQCSLDDFYGANNATMGNNTLTAWRNMQ